MSALVITPEINRRVTPITGRITIETDEAKVACACIRRACAPQDCRGINVDAIPLQFYTLAQHFTFAGNLFRERLRARGYEPVGSQLWIHGPVPSLELERVMADVDSRVWDEAKQRDRMYETPSHPLGDEHPEKTLGFVHTVPKDFAGLADYTFHGWFLCPEVVVVVRNHATTDRGGFVNRGVRFDQ